MTTENKRFIVPNLRRARDIEKLKDQFCNEKLLGSIVDLMNKAASNENKLKMKEATEKFSKRFYDDIVNKLSSTINNQAKPSNSDSIYYIIGISYYRNNAELTSKDYVVYPPKIVNSIEGNYESALRATVYTMEEAEDRLKDSYMKQICYPIKVDEDVLNGIQDGSLFNREENIERAKEALNSDEYIDALISSDTFKSLDKESLENSIYLLLTDNPINRINNRLKQMEDRHEEEQILESLKLSTANTKGELYNVICLMQNVIDEYNSYRNKPSVNKILDRLNEMNKELSNIEEELNDMFLQSFTVDDIKALNDIEIPDEPVL
jgi:hypothetical protein